MRFTSAISTNPDLDRALDEVCGKAFAAMGTGPIELAVVFLSPNTAGDPRRIAPILKRHHVDRLIGCSASGVIGAGEEIEGRPALGLTLVRMPEVNVVARSIADADLPDADAGPNAWTRLVGIAPDACAGFLVLLEPFSATPDPLISGLDFAYPASPKVGGIASGGHRPGVHVMLLDDQCLDAGSLVMGFGGNVTIEPVVAQGCKPFGQVGVITKARGQALLEISGRPTVEFLQAQLEGLAPSDLELAHHNPLFFGLALDPFAIDDPAPGDYLIRNVIGFDAKSGGLQIGDQLAVGRKLRFHLRDRQKSHDDLVNILDRSRKRNPRPPAGAMLFSCVGRGQSLYGEAGHDSRVFRERMGTVPLGGFFCNGEIGPVQGTTFLHGYTSSFGLFRPKP